MIPNGYYDISPVISSRTAVFPGDVAFERKVGLDFKSGGAFLLSSVRTTLHIGAHADAPNHYHPEGQGIDGVDLGSYLGKCQVIEVRPARGGRIGLAELGTLKGEGIQAQRVLFKTRSFPNPDSWNSDFNSLSPELVEFLAQKGVRLIGLDTPSVDPESSKKLESHQAVDQHGLAILEGLVLTEVPEGVYTLIALPLRIEGGDASPVRAVLLEFPSQPDLSTLTSKG